MDKYRAKADITIMNENLDESTIFKGDLVTIHQYRFQYGHGSFVYIKSDGEVIKITNEFFKMAFDPDE